MLFMKKEDVKYYMPVAFVSMSASAVIHDMGIRLGFWYLKETAFPFSQLTPYLFGFLPVLTMWVFKFTYRHFWAFMITNLILDIGFCFFFLNSFLPSKEILSLGVPPYQVLIITTFHALLLYSYQIWQDDALVSHSEKPNILPNLKPAAAKLLSEDRKGENEK
jgi:hypothetical protein